jgi:hypothetical protein
MIVLIALCPGMIFYCIRIYIYIYIYIYIKTSIIRTSCKGNLTQINQNPNYRNATEGKKRKFRELTIDFTCFIRQ